MVCLSRQVVAQTPLLRPGTQVQTYVEKMIGTTKRFVVGLKLTSSQASSVLGKRTVPSIPANIEKDVGEIMPGATPMNSEKVTRMAFNGEVFYSVEYGKLKTCGYCVEYLTKHHFGEVQYFLYCVAAGNAVAVIKPIHLLDKAFPTLSLDKDYDCHIQRAVVDNSFKVIPVTYIIRKAALLEGKQKQLLCSQRAKPI
ncbi:unnamed protein product [Porites lobata]|uniref:Uncharacterized protein n=1 Tax=Porites lobata TaxID=104759 RepID=A0ABN8PA88_9CNID|nr:unnamed protein product [Porites lobata]